MVKKRIGMALWLLAAAALFFFENNTGTKTLLIASVALPVFSVVCAAWTVKRMHGSLHGPDRCMTGQAVAVDHGWHGPWTAIGCRCQAEIAATNRMTGAVQRRMLEASASFPLDTSLCGMVTVRMTRLAASDWFGLCELTQETDAACTVTILPELDDVCLDPDEPDADADAAPLLIRGIGADETIGVRTYVPGDPIRMIHWKLSEKLDETMVRETGHSLESPVLLLLDSACCGHASPREMHDCVKALLSTAQALRSDGVCFQACIPFEGIQAALMTVDCPDALDELTELVLATSFRQDGEPISALLAVQYPELHPVRTLVFRAREVA